jgi:hypothetical protein
VGNGRFVYGPGGFPAGTYLGSDYGVDVVVEFETGLVVVERRPAPGSRDVAADTPAVARFDRAIQAASVRWRVLDDSGVALPGTADTVDTSTLRWTPTSGWPPGRTVTVAIEAARAVDGTELSTPVTWQFSIASGSTATQWTLFPAGAVPAVVSADDRSRVELGVRVRCDVDADVVAIRHYVGPTNSGPHVVHLWSNTGALLAEATAPPGSGWVTTPLPTPVGITAGSVVVASYVAPNGGYGFDVARFANPVTSGPLTAPADGAAGPNGCYRYGGGFPDASYLASSYGVDLVVVTRS